MSSNTDNLEKQAQDLLAQANKLADKAAKLADKGGFTLRFFGETYYPKGLEQSIRVRATADAPNEIEGWADMDEDERADALEDFIRDYDWGDYWNADYGDMPDGEWWAPSTC